MHIFGPTRFRLLVWCTFHSHWFVGKYKWEEGRVSGAVYAGDSTVADLCTEARPASCIQVAARRGAELKVEVLEGNGCVRSCRCTIGRCGRTRCTPTCSRTCGGWRRRWCACAASCSTATRTRAARCAPASSLDWTGLDSHDLA